MNFKQLRTQAAVTGRPIPSREQINQYRIDKHLSERFATDKDGKLKTKINKAKARLKTFDAKYGYMWGLL